MRDSGASRGALLLVVIAWAFGPGMGAGFAWAQADEPAGLEVGSISDLDLESVRRILDESDDVGMPAVRESRALSLEDAVRVSLENNLGLQVVALDVEVSEFQVKGARAKFHPVFGITGRAAETKRAHSDPNRADEFTENQEARAIVHQEVPTGGSVSVGIGYAREFKNEFNEFSSGGGANLESVSELGGLGLEIRQPLLKGGRVYVARRAILDAEYDNAIRRAELRAEILNVTAETKTAYYRVIQALRQIEVIEQALARDAELVRASDALFEAGRVSKVDVYSAQISRSNDQARMATARAELEIVQNELRKVIGLSVEVQLEVTDLTIPFEPLRIELESWIERALESRPEMAAARSRLEKSELAVRISKNATLPSLDLSGGFQPGFDWESWNWNAGVGFEYAIGNVGAKSQLGRARARQARTRQEYVRQKRDIEFEVRAVEIRLREGIDRLKSLILQVENARSKGEIARGRFEMGLASNLDITDADGELVRSESMLLAALVEYASNRARMEASIGGPL
jgi:outer membrane protein TolC